MPLIQMRAELAQLYKPCCDAHDHIYASANDDGEQELADHLTDMLEQVWKDKGLPEGTINKEVTTAFGKKLSSGILAGYGKGAGDVDYDTPDETMIKSLLKNTWQFAAAKNYNQLRELTQALIGDDGKLRSYDEFKAAAIQINSDYTSYLNKAEYNLAVAGSQMASKWAEFEQNGTTMVEFDVVMDSQTTEICRPLNGVVVSFDSPMLAVYTPPNHFGCRTILRDAGNSKATPEKEIVTPDIPQMFRVNLAKEGLAFPKGHPYFKDTPASVLNAGVKLSKNG